MKATIRLFGQFRDLASQPRLELELAESALVPDVKAAVGRALFGLAPSDEERSLLEESALASHTDVLSPEAELAPLVDPCGRLELAILPPVCGG